jgi:DNA polymerase-1
MVLGAMYEHAMDDLGVRKTYRDEMALWPTTIEMERRGVAIDERRMAECRDECERVLEEASNRLREVSGVDQFNISSTKQLVKLLFGPDSVAKLPVLKRTKKGQPKTDAEALAPHKQHPIVQDILRVRANSQAIKLFFDKYSKLASKDNDGNVIMHPGFKQWGTLTGRYSCSEPNMQQVSDPDTTSSIAAEFVVDIRQVFVPRPGCVWYCPDYSQIEVVIFADVSGEPALIDAILSGQDIHGVTAERVWGGEGNDRGFKMARMILETDDDGLVREKLVECNYRITDLEKSVDKKIVRKRAKAVTFTKIFGGGPLALMRWISVARPEAVEILNAYDDAFPTMVARMHEIEMKGKKDGYVVNPFGRRLVVDPWNAYRAINHIVQSAAADLMKCGMRKCAAYLKDTGLDAMIILTIHDELIFEFRKGHNLKHVIREIKNRMSDHGGALRVPVKVDVERVTERWSDKTKVEL